MYYLRLLAPILIIISSYSFTNACSIDNLGRIVTYNDTPDCISVLIDYNSDILISNECSMTLKLISSENMTTSESTASFELNEGEDISIDSERDESVVLWSLSDGREGRITSRFVQHSDSCPGPFGCVTVINHAHSSLNLMCILIILMGLLRYRRFIQI